MIYYYYDYKLSIVQYLGELIDLLVLESVAVLQNHSEWVGLDGECMLKSVAVDSLKTGRY